VFALFWGLLISRLFRIILLWGAGHLHAPRWERPRFRATRQLLTEGGWIQGVTASGIIRDNLHLILVGPLHGKAWAGFYGWALQLCTVTSQAFVQVAARTSIPFFAQEPAAGRWRSCLDHIRVLAAFVGPVLVGTLVAAPTIDEYLSGGTWAPAVAVLPLLFARMVPGVATTPLGTLLLIEKGGRALAVVTTLWTTGELIAGLVGLLWLGPSGLAWSYAIVVWFGLGVFIAMAVEGLADRRATDVLAAIGLRPGLVTSAAAAAVMILVTDWLGIATPEVRIMISMVVVVVGCAVDSTARRTIANTIRVRRHPRPLVGQVAGKG
jgi:O-antigen/teichoic acid export membrane protein